MSERNTELLIYESLDMEKNISHRYFKCILPMYDKVYHKNNHTTGMSFN